ncbi:hypothetical protein [uncultured Bacteroides sp.]|uniref:hypothetical protein n=1 Tax=uncultured Bacteroides sp. TaxID=162156 RepID=UPI002608D345|nr:hypothetical protein [uncultured Bacteroides sp.]
MTRYEIERELDSLYKDLEIAHNSDEQTVCRVFNADSKREAIQVITDEIDNYESALEEYNLPDDDGMDYNALCRVQGLARYA